MGAPKIDFDPERDECSITITTDDAQAQAWLNAKLLDSLIPALLDARGRMKEKTPAAPPAQFQHVPGENDPAWIANLATTPSGEPKPALYVRHSGLGWRGLYLKPDDARKMAKALALLAGMAEKIQ